VSVAAIGSTHSGKHGADTVVGALYQIVSPKKHHKSPRTRRLFG
jgi:hypothetical protein